MTDEREPTDAERREAAALAQALERGTASAELPGDALETAALLRHSAGAGSLPEDRRHAIIEEVLRGAPRPAEPESRSPMRWLAWLVPASGALAAVAGVALVFVFSGQESAPAAPGYVSTQTVALPSPPATLLSAQAAVANAGADDDGREVRALDREMRAYRAALHAVLAARYGGPR